MCVWSSGDDCLYILLAKLVFVATSHWQSPIHEWSACYNKIFAACSGLSHCWRLSSVLCPYCKFRSGACSFCGLNQPTSWTQQNTRQAEETDSKSVNCRGTCSSSMQSCVEYGYHYIDYVWFPISLQERSDILEPATLWRRYTLLWKLTESHVYCYYSCVGTK